MATRRRPSADGQQALGEETIDTQNFFTSRKAAAVLKHEILKGYVPPFVGKTGKFSPGNRVVIIDGFAGTGRYEDGSAGSPAIFIEAAQRTPGRNLECYFVEKDPANYQRLRAMLEAEGDAITWEAWQGTAGAHVDEVLTRAAGLPLFMFLDPFGIGPDFTQVQDIFRRRPSGRARSPATEMLFRVDADALRRPLGVHRSDTVFPARDALLRSVDTLGGGTWWRDDDDGERSGEPYLEWFFQRYVARLSDAVGCHGWYTDVKQKPPHQPAYYLVFLTRHMDGVEVFGETLSLALAKWRRTVFDEAVAAESASGQLSLLDPDEQFHHDERCLEDGWHDTIERNVRDLLRRRGHFVVRDEIGEVFGDTIGRAREKHLRVALKQLAKDGTTSSNGVGNLYPKHVIRAADAQL